jgi:hypothetical protein
MTDTSSSQGTFFASGQGAIGRVEGSLSQQFGDSIAGDKQVAELIANLNLAPGTFSTAELLKLLRSRAEKQALWQTLVDKLVALEVAPPPALVSSLRALVFARHLRLEPSAATYSARELFQAIVRAHGAWGQREPQQLLVLVDALAAALAASDPLASLALADWVAEALSTLAELDADELAQRRPGLLAQARRLLAGAATTLMLTIREHPADAERFRLELCLSRPGVAPQPLEVRDDNCYTLDEIKAYLSELRQSLPAWARAETGLLVEFLLPFELLCRLDGGAGDWQLAAWPCLDYLPRPVNKHVERPLGALHPIVVRYADREDEGREEWERRCRALFDWLANPQAAPPPRLACPTNAHPCHLPLCDWESSTSLVGVVCEQPDRPEDLLDSEGWLVQMLLAGLPLGLWPAPGLTEADCADFFAELFALSPQRIEGLPGTLHTRRKRRDPWAAGLVLFWDDYRRSPPLAQPLAAPISR